MKNLVIRSLSGIIYVAIITLATLVDDVLIFTGLAGVLVALATTEFHCITNAPTSKLSMTLDVVGAVLFYLCVTYGIITESIVIVLAALIAYPIIRQSAQLYYKGEDSLGHLSLALMSVLYIAVPMIFITVMYYLMGGRAVLLLFILLWLNDTFAYMVGCSIGRHRLFERISPKKSWEGFFGGLTAAIAGAIVFGLLCPDFFFSADAMCTGGATAVVRWGILGLLVSVAGTFGDLCESQIKRAHGVKDSGNLIPGHGGILDRIDSLLFAGPVMLLALLLMI